jgi:hypothetical protein
VTEPAAATGRPPDSPGIALAGGAVIFHDLPLLDPAPGLVDRFLARQTDNTRRAYARDLGDFAAWLGVADAHAVARLLLAAPGPGRAN